MPSLKAGTARPGGVAAAAAAVAMEGGPSLGLECPPLISQQQQQQQVVISRSAEPESVVTISRTAEVLYMLSHGAQLEHPHMINVHYPARQPGPTLRDVKTRLVVLRGKGMPDSFSWSYKRKYRNTFIWCDLFDDDLIVSLPGSEEYVLKAVKLFDVKPPLAAALKDDKAVAVEPEELPRPKSPARRASVRLHVEDDVSTAIKKSLLLINVPPSPSPAATDVTTTTTPSSNLLMSNLKGGGAAHTERHINASSQTAHVMRDEATSVSPRRKETIHEEEEETSTSVPPPQDDDPFLYGVLRKATKLGSSFRPRLCRGVDVIESTRIKTKLYYRAKDQSPPAPPPPPQEEQQSKAFGSLQEYFESKDLASAASKSPTPEALDASYRKTMEVLANLPNSRGASRVHHSTHDRHVSCKSGNKQGQHQGQQQEQQQEEEMMILSLQKSKLHDHVHDDIVSRFCAIHGLDADVVYDGDVKIPVSSVVEVRDRESKPRSRSVVKRATMASTVRAKATVKTPVECERMIKAAAAAAPRDSHVMKVEDERSEMDSRGVHNGNEQGGLKSTLVEEGATPAAGDEAVTEGAKRWPLEPTARPRDFKSREDRPLIPGLTTMDWEKSLQEACLLSEPPANLVLHGCLQCGRMFKWESLQVHMRGCHGANKPKQRRA